MSIRIIRREVLSREVNLKFTEYSVYRGTRLVGRFPTYTRALAAATGFASI